MRCYICDYVEGEPKSLYNFSLIDPKGHKHRRVLVDPKTGKEICNYCYEPPQKQETSK